MKNQDHQLAELKQMRQILHDCRTSVATIVMSMEVSLACLDELNNMSSESNENMRDIQKMVVNSGKEAARLSEMIGGMSEICEKLKGDK